MYTPGVPIFRRGGHLFMVVAAVLVGLGGASAAVAFRLLIRAVSGLAWGGVDGVAQIAEEGLLAEAADPIVYVRQLSWGWRIAVPAFGGLLVGPLIYYFAREARGHGVPEVMKAVALKGGIIRARIVAIKALASAISIGTGGSVGREGPIVQIGSAFGSTFGQVFRLSTAQIRTLVGCGAAAGISATFNAPIAGALFAAEVIVGDWAVSYFTPIVIASVVAVVVSRFFLGNDPAFIVPDFQIVSPFELAPYMLAGILAGLVAVLFIRTLSLSEDVFERLPIPVPLQACVGGAMVGVIGIWLPEVFGVGYSAIDLSLAGQMSALTLIALVFAKILATSITIGSGGSGGIFAPSLFLGAMTGGALGTFVHQAFPEATATSGAYALVTMGAVVAATTHAPLSAIIVIFELTQTIDIVPALMSACVVSTLVSQLLNRDSIYTAKLVRQGIDLLQTVDPNVLKSLFVRDVLDPEPEVVRSSANFQTLLDLVVQSKHTQFYVLNERDELLGAIALDEVRRLIFERDTLQHLVVAEDLVDSARPTLREDEDLDVVMHLFSQVGVVEFAVVDAADPKRLVGTVREKDVVEARNREWLRRDLAGGVSSSMSVVGKGQNVDLGGGYGVRELIVPHHFVGKSLRELAIRERTGIQVLLVRCAGPPGGPTGAVMVASPDEKLGEGDCLVVAGPADALDRFETF